MSANTERGIMLAIARIRHGKQKRISANRKFSIASVAEEAGVSNATIHNRYPQLAEHIRKLQKEDSKVGSARQESEVDDLRRQIKELREQLQKRDNELKKIAILNLQMVQEIKRLTYEATSKASAKDKIISISKPKANR